jgi:mRNA interferase RelE/StbE
MAKYKIEIKHSASKEIENFPKPDLKRVLGKIVSLADNPRPYDAIKLSAQDNIVCIAVVIAFFIPLKMRC